MKSCIALIGFMGSGKSTVGRILSRSLGLQFVDTDAAIETDCGLSVREIFRLKGESYFRQAESLVLTHCFESEKCVLATGGGLWMNEENQKRLLRDAWCVWLKVNPEQAWERVRHNLAERPLLAGAEDPRLKIQELLLKRDPIYALAHACVDTTGKTPEEVSWVLMKKLKEQRPFDLSALSL
jgi:shikimate kinase